MTNILIAFATLKEAKDTIHILNAKQIEGKPFYSFSKGAVIIMGWGCLAAAYHVSQHLYQFDEVWNIGIAGALHSHFSFGQIQEIQCISKNLTFPLNLNLEARDVAQSVYPAYELQKTGVRLMTSDYPIHSSAARQALSLQADLVDMEGYGVAFAAYQNNKPCKIFKAISDFGDEQAQKSIRQALPALSSQMAITIRDKVSSIEKIESSCPKTSLLDSLVQSKRDKQE